MKPLDRILADIARDRLGIATLETRRSDGLDFHEVAVWQVEAALMAAFEAGSRSGGCPEADGSLPARFDAYEVHGVREFGDGGDKFCEQVSDDEAQFWSLYGHAPGRGPDCIGDFATREHAEEVLARITGRRYTDAAINGRREA